MSGLEIASGVVGIISLGIQACQGLVNYYASWKDAPKDITDTVKSLNILETILGLLQKEISHDALKGDAADTVVKCCETCHDGIQQLDKELLKFKEVERFNFAQKVHLQLRRLEYPFKEGTSIKLRGIISDIQGNLALAIDTLHLQNEIRAIERLTETGDEIKKLSARFNSLDMHQKCENQKILDWLSPLLFFDKQADNLERRQKGTGNWFFGTPQYESWISGTEKVLWASGQPGAGKTLLVAAIIDDLETKFRTSNIGIAFIYCDYKETKMYTIINLLGSLLHQLLRRDKVIPLDIRNLFLEHESKKMKPSQGDLLKELRSIILQFSRVFIVVDALDECSSDYGTRRKFMESLLKLPGNVSLLCTSRYLGDIKEGFSQASHLEIRASEEDVELFLKAQIQSLPRLRGWCRKSEGLQDTIIQNLSSKAQGMFLLAELYIESLRLKTRIGDAKRALENLPDELDDVYEKALERIQAQSQDEARLAVTVLSWLAHAIRPLTIEEIRHAVAIMELKPDATSIDPDDLPEEDIILTVCGGLVYIDQNSMIIRLVHQTAQEYFDKNRQRKFFNAEYLIPKACFRYTMLKPFRQGVCSTKDELEDRTKLYSLFKYAYVIIRVHAADKNETTFENEMWSILQNPHNLSAIYQFFRGFQNEIPLGPQPPLCMAAAFGLKNAIIRLLDMGKDIDDRDEDGDTGLMNAALDGHLDIVKLLLDRNADIHATNSKGESALHHAAMKGYAEIVDLLIQNGAAIDNQNLDGYTPLHFAAAHGSLATIELLDQRGANLEARCASEGTPLEKAVWSQHVPTVQSLISKGAKVDASNKDGNTALHYAAWKDLIQISEILIHSGADIEVENNFQNRPLHMSAVSESVQVLEYLIAQGADIEARGQYFMTPLDLASANGYVYIVKVLLDKGAKVTAHIQGQSKNGVTALHIAAKNGHHEVVSLLLDKGLADIDTVDDSGHTPLTLSAGNGKVSVVSVLVERGADIRTRNPIRHRTPLIEAAGSGHKEILETLLLVPGAKIDDSDNDGNTALHFASFNDRVDCVELLLNNGSNVDSQNGRGFTSLHMAAAKIHTAVMNLLLENGADVNCANSVGFTPLHAAAWKGNKETVKLFISKGSDIKLKTKEGQTASDIAKSYGFDEIADILAGC